MQALKHLFDTNRKWADKVKESDPDFFLKLSNQQTLNTYGLVVLTVVYRQINLLACCQVKYLYTVISQTF